MISAQPTSNSPAGNWRGRVPGTTTERAGTRPRYVTGSLPVTSMIGVLAVSDTCAPSTAPASINMPSVTMQREPMKAPSSTMTGRAPEVPRPPFVPRGRGEPYLAMEPSAEQVARNEAASRDINERLEESHDASETG